jgi:hypothetical protein
MPLVRIKPNAHLRVRYPAPRRGLVEYDVEAEGPVDTFVLDEEGLVEFNSRNPYVYSYYGGFPYRRSHHQELRLPFRGWWYLVINNPSKKEPVAVHYEVYG